MENPLVKTVSSELAKFNLKPASLVAEAYYPDNFGNAEAVFQIGSLLLRFLRDRSDDTVELGSAGDPTKFYTIEDIAILLGWITLDDLLTYDANPNFAEPPPGPMFPIAKALRHVEADYDQLEELFAPAQLGTTGATLHDIERRRMDAMFT